MVSFVVKCVLPSMGTGLFVVPSKNVRRADYSDQCTLSKRKKKIRRIRQQWLFKNIFDSKRRK